MLQKIRFLFLAFFSFKKGFQQTVHRGTAKEGLYLTDLTVMRFTEQRSMSRRSIYRNTYALILPPSSRLDQVCSLFQVHNCRHPRTTYS